LPVTTEKVGELAGNSWKCAEDSGTNYERYQNGMEVNGNVQKKTEETGNIKKDLVSTR
jgi:hypothetical protein